MVQIIGRNRNINDEASVSTVTVGAGSAVVLAPANPNRTYLRIDLSQGTNDRDVFIRLYEAAQDNVKHGFVIGRNLGLFGSYFELFWEIPTDNIYTGEVSAIGRIANVDVHVTEY